MIPILKAWELEKGLVTIQLAADIIGIDHSSVSRAVDRGKITSYEYGKKRYLSFTDVIFYKTQREQRKNQSS